MPTNTVCGVPSVGVCAGGGGVRGPAFVGTARYVTRVDRPSGGGAVLRVSLGGDLLGCGEAGAVCGVGAQVGVPF